MPSTEVEIIEVGPRDGLQNEARTLPVETRIELITRLVDPGVRRIEAVSFVRPDLVPRWPVPRRSWPGCRRREGVSYIGLALNAKGAERAATAGCAEVNVVVPVTDAFSTRNQGSDVATMLTRAKDAVAVAREAGLGVSVTLPVSFGCPFQGEVSTEQVAAVVERVLDLGIDELAFADTIGVGVPRQVRALAALVQGDERVPRLRFHFHNTRNTGYANASAALGLLEQHPRLSLDASVGGFGGCPFAPAATGNIATEDLAYLVRREGYRADPDLDLAAMAGIATWLSGELDSPVQGLIAKAGDFPAA